MTTQIAIRLEDNQLDALDAEVAEGRAATRSDAVRRAIAHLERERSYRRDNAILTALIEAGEEVYPDLVGMHNGPYPELD